jgi:4-amino-4-deoxy-L-arabinose transferase-like glycosyltransferase
MKTVLLQPPTHAAAPVEAQTEGHVSGWRDACVAAAICALAAFLVLSIGTAFTSRPITDEGLFADPAYTLATKGYMGSPALRDNTHLLRIAQRTYWIFPLDPLLQSVWYRVFGAGLFSMRSLSVCFGLLGLGSIFIFAWKLSRDLRVGLIALALTAVDYLYIYGSASGRMDVICAGLGYSGLAAYMALREKNFSLAILVGNALIVASGATHPNGFLYFIALVLLALYFDRRRLRWQHLPLALVPYLVAASLWGGYIARDPQAFLAQIRANAHDGGRLQGFRNPLMGFVREVTVRYATAYGFRAHSFGDDGPIYLKSLQLFAYLAGIAGALLIPELRRRSEIRALLLILLLCFVYLAVCDGQKAYYYLIHFVPIYAAVLAIVVNWLRTSRKVNLAAVTAVLVIIIAAQLAGLGYRIRLNAYGNVYAPAVKYLQENTRPGQVINANIAFLFGLNFSNNLIDDAHLTNLSDYFVIDNEVAERLKNASVQNPALYDHVMAWLENCYARVYVYNSITIYSLRKTPCETSVAHQQQ